MSNVTTLYPLLRSIPGTDRVDRVTVRGFDNDANECDAVVVEIRDGELLVTVGPGVTVRTADEDRSHD